MELWKLSAQATAPSLSLFMYLICTHVGLHTLWLVQCSGVGNRTRLGSVEFQGAGEAISWTPLELHIEGQSRKRLLHVWRVS